MNLMDFVNIQTSNAIKKILCLCILIFLITLRLTKFSSILTQVKKIFIDFYKKKINKNEYFKFL